LSTASKAFSIEDLRSAARHRLPQEIFDFFDGGAEDELTLGDNQAAFRRIRLLHKVLTDVS
jgi:(S)-mandelate dehydrogenase